MFCEIDNRKENVCDRLDFPCCLTHKNAKYSDEAEGEKENEESSLCFILLMLLRQSSSKSYRPVFRTCTELVYFPPLLLLPCAGHHKLWLQTPPKSMPDCMLISAPTWLSGLHIQSKFKSTFVSIRPHPQNKIKTPMAYDLHLGSIALLFCSLINSRYFLPQLSLSLQSVNFL